MMIGFAGRVIGIVLALAAIGCTAPMTMDLPGGCHQCRPSNTAAPTGAALRTRSAKLMPTPDALADAGPFADARPSVAGSRAVPGAWAGRRSRPAAGLAAVRHPFDAPSGTAAPRNSDRLRQRDDGPSFRGPLAPLGIADAKPIDRSGLWPRRLDTSVDRESSSGQIADDLRDDFAGRASLRRDLANRRPVDGGPSAEEGPSSDAGPNPAEDRFLRAAGLVRRDRPVDSPIAGQHPGHVSNEFQSSARTTFARLTGSLLKLSTYTSVGRVLTIGRKVPDLWIKPSHARDWKPAQAALPYAVWDREGATIYNVRQCRWRTEEDFRLRHTDWEIRWTDVRTLDFIVVPFRSAPQLAHTMLSFGLADGRQLVLSVEARQEKGESYSPLPGAARQFELMYILGDEVDLVGLRAEVRRDDVFLYRSIASPEQSSELLRDVLLRLNDIRRKPEFYDTLGNNCTTNLVFHINRCWPELVPKNDVRLMLPGHSDQLVYDLGLMNNSAPFPLVREGALISGKARQHIVAENFSAQIRR